MCNSSVHVGTGNGPVYSLLTYYFLIYLLKICIKILFINAYPMNQQISVYSY